MECVADEFFELGLADYRHLYAPTTGDRILGLSIYPQCERICARGERGGYIPFCDHRCPPDVKPDDYLYYLDLKEEMFGMKAD